MQVAHVSFMPRIISGVVKKYADMAKAAENIGFACDFIILNNDIERVESNLIYKKFIPFTLPLSLKKQQQLFTYLLIEHSIDLSKYDYIILRYPGACSIGSSYFYAKYGKNLLTEHHTNEEIEYAQYRKTGMINNIKFALEGFCARRHLKKVAGIIGVTNEILALELEKSGKKPLFLMTNGMDVSGLPLASKSDTQDTLNIIFVASCEANWHGIDRVIAGIKNYKGEIKITLHLVGNFDRAKYGDAFIRCHGELRKEALDRVFEQIDVAISTLALHRKDMRAATSLKSREYLARGIPFVYAYDDDDLKGDEAFALKIPSDESPLDIELLIGFSKKNHAREKIREFAMSKIAWQVKIEALRRFLESLQSKRRFEDVVLDFAYAVFNREGVGEGAHILELGCGKGEQLVEINRAGDSAYGVDVLDFKCEAAKENLKNAGMDASRVKLIPFDSKEGFAIPFDADFFDAVFSYQVFEHVKNHDIVAQELYRVLKKGGVVFSEFAATYPPIDCHTELPPLHLLGNRKAVYRAFLFFKKIGWFADEKKFRKTYLYFKNYLHYISYAKMDRIYRNAGFEVVDLTYERRASRLLNDGVGRPMELVRYKLYGEHGHSKNIGIFVQIYLSWHVFWYRLTKNRVILLRKNSD